MSSVKTAVSLSAPLFEQAEAVARELNVSRSRLFALAIEEFLRKHEGRKLFESLDAAYADAPDPSERRLQRAMRERHRRAVQGEW